METDDEESWTSEESDDNDQHHHRDQQHTMAHNFGGSDFVGREADASRSSTAPSQRQSTLFALQHSRDVPPLCRKCEQQQRLNGTGTQKPVQKERHRQVEDKAVQAEEEQEQHYQQYQPQEQHRQQQQQQQRVEPRNYRRDFLLVPREHGADLHEWSSVTQPIAAGGDYNAATTTTLVPWPMEQQRRHVPSSAVAGAGGTSLSVTSLPSPPKSILRQPQQRHQQPQPQHQQQQQHQHQYTYERHGNEPGHYWEDRGEIGVTVGDDDDAEEQRALYETMQRNLALHQQPSPRADLYPSAPFNGPFFRLHEVSPDGRASRPLNAIPSGAEMNKTASTAMYGPQYQTLPPMSPRRAASGRPLGNAVNHATAPPPPPPPPPPAGWAPPRQQLQKQQRPYDDSNAQRRNEEDGLVVVWPPFPATDDQQNQQDNNIDQQEQQHNRPKSEAPTPKNVRRDFPEEYARQERMQAEAERQRAERNARLRDKQLQAVRLQQEQLSRLTTPQQHEQQHGHHLHHPQYEQMSPADTGIGISEPENATVASANRPSTSHSQTQLLSPSVAAVRVFETRPMGAGERTVTAYDPRLANGSVAYENGGGVGGAFACDTDSLLPLQSPLASSVTWRRTYVVDSEHVDERNEILTSDERLARERFNIDMLRRREQFIEKPEQPVEIRRTGKRWQPPPEKPYRWPTPSTVSEQVETYGPLSVQVNGGGTAVDEHRWVPVVRQPEYKTETRDFVPDEPEQQIKGHGTGPIDDVARRQTAGVIMPSPDGSHRPRTEFDGARKPPAGGFVPHAPNVVRRARTRALRAEEQITSGPVYADAPRRQRHAAAASMSATGRARHASAVPSTARGTAMRRRDSHSEDDYEHDQQQPQRHQHPAHDWEAAPPRRHQQHQRRQTTVVTIDDACRAASSAQTPALNGHDDAHPPSEGVYPEDDQGMDEARHTSTIVTLGPLPNTDVRRRIRAFEVRDRNERSRSAIARARADRSQSPAAHRAQERIRQLTQASPTPPSYEQARKYVPPPLPPGHKSATSATNGHAVGVADSRDAIPRRHARRMADAVQREASAHGHNREPLAAKLASPHQFRRRSATTNRPLVRAESSTARTSGRDRDALRARESPPSGRVHDAVYSTVRPIGDRVPSSAMYTAPMPRGWTTDQPPPTDGEVRSYRASRTVEHRRVQRRN